MNHYMSKTEGRGRRKLEVNKNFSPLAKNRHIDAWAIVQNVSGTRLQGKQFNESTESSTDTTVSIAVTSLHSVQQSHRLF
jgi:hypothetical protein